MNKDVLLPLSSGYLNNEEEQERESLIDVQNKKDIIDSAFIDFGVHARVKDYSIGPAVTRFNLDIAPSCSIKSLANVINDIQMRLGGLSVRYDINTKGFTNPGLEVENNSRSFVSLKTLYDALPPANECPYAIPLGVRADGQIPYINLKEAPHMLLGGTTGSGKSIFINSLITTLMMRNSPDTLRFVLFDPKRVELNRYKESPHLLCPIVYEAKEAKYVLEKLKEEMDSRYADFCDSNSCNIEEHNMELAKKDLPALPHIVVIIDEYADLVDTDKSIADPVICLAQKARAAGIHLIVSTQRPSTNVVSGVLKANLPVHIAFMLTSSIDSITLLGEAGAEKLLGRGDMLIQTPLVSRLGLTRLQGSFVRREETKKVVQYFKDNYPLRYNPRFLLDE